VGYTNAGKSTLLNRLSGASVYVADQLFATLDPIVRRVDLPGGQPILVADTVGFIQKLPHTLVAAFRATLEEISEAELLVHVVDASHCNALQQVEVVEETLAADLGITNVERVMAINKIDLIEGLEAHKTLDCLRERYPEGICISGLRGAGMEEILGRMKELLEQRLVHVVVRIPYTQGALIARFYEVATVESETHEEDCVELTGTLNSRLLTSYEDYVV